ncbi:carnitine O-acetyltransferase isoform X1 [Drosophila willistoni]|nr:carnitine O-acetyltransferase isoform X1 [Drosophila willistoni]
MYKYQSSPSDSIEKPNVEMRFLNNGRVFWNLTKNSMNYQSGNAIVRLLPASYSNKSSDPPAEPREKQNLLTYHVLPLKETLDKFTATVEPLLSPAEFEQQKKINEEFLCTEGGKLQKLLEAVGAKEKNWLAHRWLNAAYLQYRDPVTVYVSPGMTFPRQEFKDINAFLDYTSKVVYGLGEFNDMVKCGKIPVVKMGKNELDNSQFGKVFGTCRIPKPVTDEIVYNPRSDYVVVIYKNHFYKLRIYNNQGLLLSAVCLREQLQNILQKETKHGVPYGILTTDNRDNWATAYEQLCKQSGNKESFATIQGALFTVSLDECTKLPKGEETNQLILSLIHGGGSKVNSGNRWMDKTIQLVVNPNGNVGFTYEHSPAEGQPIAMMMDYVVKKMKEDPNFGKIGASKVDEEAKKLQLCAPDDSINKSLATATTNIDKLVEKLQIKVLKFEGYGKGFIKKQRLGPDSFVQMALQLAFYRMHNEPAAQYESAHLRIFEGGRTETIRSCSNESLKFCKTMVNSSATAQDKADALRAAVTSHQAYTRLALQGRGVDRHLLGLKLMALENSQPIPKFYSSPGFVKSASFRMSTSQVATLYDAFMGYGPAVDNGYACCYNPRENDIILAISNWRFSVTDHLKYAQTLESSFCMMKEVLEQATPPPAAPAKSKL